MSRLNADSRAKTRCYVIRKTDNKKFVFQFNPTSVPYSRSANYTTIDSPGMAYPLTQFVSGNVREFSFELFYYDNAGGHASGKIKKARKFLESLLPPEKNKKKFKKPPVFEFAYGYFVKKLVLLQLDVDDQWLDEDGQPMMTTFTLTVRQVGK